MLLPALNQARRRAQSTACVSNLKQIGLGLNGYADAYDGFTPKSEQRDGGSFAYWKWQDMIAAFVSSYKIDHNKDYLKYKVFFCPASTHTTIGLKTDDLAVVKNYGINEHIWERPFFKGNLRNISQRMVVTDMDAEFNSSFAKPAVIGRDPFKFGDYNGAAVISPDGVTQRHLGGRGANMIFGDLHIGGLEIRAIPDNCWTSSFWRPDQNNY